MKTRNEKLTSIMGLLDCSREEAEKLLPGPLKPACKSAIWPFHRTPTQSQWPIRHERAKCRAKYDGWDYINPDPKADQAVGPQFSE